MVRKSRLREDDDEVLGYYLGAENFLPCRLEHRERELRTLRLRCPLVDIYRQKEGLLYKYRYRT
jgi:hypothetical protein